MKITYFVNNRKKNLFRLLLFSYNYLKYFFLRRYYFDFNSFIKILKYSGHVVVVECLDLGSKELGLDYQFYKNNSQFSRIVVVNSGIENLKFCIDNKKDKKIDFIVAGPNLVITPNDHNNILTHELIDLIITPSKWVSDFYCNLQPSLKNKISEWPSGINHKYWYDLNLKRDHITFYVKDGHGPLFNIDEYIKYISNYGYKINIINYNKYNNKEYRKALNKSSFLIYFSNVESQGLAIAEAWSCNTPTLIWNSNYININGHKVNVSSCPYLSSSCGNFFDNLENFKVQFNKSVKNYNSYKPRKWVIENMTYKISVNNLINSIKTRIEH